MDKRKEFTHVIVVDEDNRPMSWGGDQLCYCTNDRWQDEHHPVKIYTKATAKKLIAKTISFRTQNRMEPGNYRTMPVILNR